MKNIRTVFFGLLMLMMCAACTQESINNRQIIDFNFDWQFRLEDSLNTDNEWKTVRIPHDWSIELGYQKENTSASTGFVPGGVGWYQKGFKIEQPDKNKAIWIEFDGVYCNSEVWINDQYLGFRPNGYSSFKYELTDYLNYGATNTIKVKVDHKAYADTRWYTGSGIYRSVRLVKASLTHIEHWGVQVTTPLVTESKAIVQIKTQIANPGENTSLNWVIEDAAGTIVSKGESTNISQGAFEAKAKIQQPQRWDIESPNLYILRSVVKVNGKQVDETNTTFGVRSIAFDADRGFLLNHKPVKIKGVNMHHDAGALGAAVTKHTWENRVRKLKSIGVNAIRMSHNPHSIEFMEVCDEMGMLVMDEFFDEWHKPKDKNLNWIGDNKAKGEIAQGYSEHFLKWAERDLKDLIRRDFNHPSVIMWSIGNEIEWTFPYYSKAFREINPVQLEFDKKSPIFEPEKVKPVFDRITQGKDSLAIVAKILTNWVKEMDTTRPTVCGSVRPAISLVSGYGKAVDVLGFNYRAEAYDEAHRVYPDLKIIGSENWGAYSEWKAVNERDFIAGMFAWTGFAYLGEAGPWPRKGLEIAFFDYAGFKTPRGHFFETLWKEDPKVYAVTTLASESEFSYTKRNGWQFDIQWTQPPVTWKELRKWEWYPNVSEHWNYDKGEEVIVQVYTNCEEVELLVNNRSMGRKKLNDFEDDHIVKWLVPYEEGNVIIKGYNNGKHVSGYALFSNEEIFSLSVDTDKDSLMADNYDLTHVVMKALDKNGRIMKGAEIPVRFSVTGPAKIVAVDNGWEMNVSSHYTNEVTTYNGQASAIVRNTGTPGTVIISGWLDNEEIIRKEIKVY